MLLLSVVHIFEGKASVFVSQSVKNTEGKHVYNYDGFWVTPRKYEHVLTLSSPTVLQSLFLKHKNGRFDLLSYLIIFIGVFQLLRIFRSLDKYGVFSVRTARYIRNLGYIYILGSLIKGFKGLYSIVLVKDLTQQIYKVDSVPLDSYFSNLFFGFLLLLIAAVYKKACQLKEDQEFTI